VSRWLGASDHVDRHPILLYVVLRVISAKNHTYCLRHLRENFLTTTNKIGIHKDSLKDLIKEIFIRIAYTLTTLEYNVAYHELRACKL